MCTCVVIGERRTSDLDVNVLRPPTVTRHIRYVLLINIPNKFNLLFVAINLFAYHQTFSAIKYNIH